MRNTVRFVVGSIAVAGGALMAGAPASGTSVDASSVVAVLPASGSLDASRFQPCMCPICAGLVPASEGVALSAAHAGGFALI